jgi:hypothetical protein
MTEAEWLASDDPQPMLEPFLRPRIGRKVYLFLVAYLRRLWHLLLDPRSRRVVEAAERYADGAIQEGEYTRISFEAYDVPRGDDPTEPAALARSLATTFAWLSRPSESHWWVGDLRRLPPCGAPDLLRDIFGNPFRPPALDPAWLSWHDGTVPKLAQAIYKGHALPSGHLNDLPILADALEDAGCSDAHILAHCRGEGPHVRGCWVVDLLLGKE